MPSVLDKEKKSSSSPHLDMSIRNPVHTDCVASIILGGGRGTRLFPLTDQRCKPATPFGGRYTLIDVPISNSLTSHVDKIFVVTQFLSSSLHKHIHRTYRFDSMASGFIELLSPQEKPSGRSWFQGTADAVRQNLDILKEVPVEYFLILSGDQLYRMDYSDLLYFALRKEADLVVATLPVSKKDATRMGIMQVNREGGITNFVEKPTEHEILEKYRCSDLFLDEMGIRRDHGNNYLANMGVYLFKREALLKLLEEDEREDFGKHLIPSQVELGNTYAFLHQGYWEDIGTIKAFYDANLALTKESPPFDCYDESFPLFSYAPCLPGPKILHGQVNSSIICQGCIIHAKEITGSIIGPCTHIGKGTVVADSYIMGNDFLTPSAHPSTDQPNSFEIGENCIIRKAIVDKNVRLGNNVRLTNEKGLDHYDGDNVYIRDGIIVVAKGADLPEGYTL